MGPVYCQPGSQLWPELSSLAHAQKWNVRELAEKPLSLEETFLALTEGEAGKGASA